MPDCEEYFDLISAYIDGELPDGEKDGLLSHLASCERCRAVYDTLSSVSDELRENMEEPPEGLLENVMAAVRSESGYPLAGASGNQKKRRAVIFRRAALAAACLAVVILAVPTLSKLGRMGSAGSANNAAAPSASMMFDYTKDSAAPAEAPAAMRAESADGMCSDEEVYESEPTCEEPDSANAKSADAPEESANSAADPEEAPDTKGIPFFPADGEVPDGEYDLIITIEGDIPGFFSEYAFSGGGDSEYAVVPTDTAEAFLSSLDSGETESTGSVSVEQTGAGTGLALVLIK